MKKKGKLKKVERLEIKILLDKEYSQRRIAKALDRSPNTISYEIRVNSVCGIYDPHKAQTKISWRRTHIRKDWKKIDQNKELRKYITDKLELHWNPDEISGRMKKDKEPFYASKSAIYQWLRSPRGQYYCKYLYTKRYGKKKQVKKTERVMIPNRISITERSLGASNRTRYGHLESDSIVSGRQGKGGVSVLQERKSRYIDGRIMDSMSSRDNAVLINEMLENKKSLSITTDNGIEYKSHEGIDVPVFFCDPYSSWQKGSVENVNKMIRRYFPKGTDFAGVSQEELDRVLRIINSKPRKILGYRTAYEVAVQSGLLKERVS
jgi:transposase, IS30 family